MQLTGKVTGIVSMYIQDIVREETTDVDTVHKLMKSPVSL